MAGCGGESTRMSKLPTPPNGNGTEWYRLIMLGMNILIIPILIWAVKVEIRLTTMEGNRYTSQDALVDARILDVKLLEHSQLDGHPLAIQRIENLEEDVHTLENLHDAP